MSPPEAKLWTLLRRSSCAIRFRRQHPIGPYVADFYCPAAKIVIEVDGSAHDFEARAARDVVRDAYMRNLGLTVVRIPAADLYQDAVAIAESLIVMCSDRIGPSTTQLL